MDTLFAGYTSEKLNTGKLIYCEFPKSFSAGFKALSHAGRLSFITEDGCGE